MLKYLITLIKRDLLRANKLLQFLKGSHLNYVLCMLCCLFECVLLFSICVNSNTKLPPEIHCFITILRQHGVYPSQKKAKIADYV